MPHNFSFVIEGLLAGMERPGTWQKLGNDFEYLRQQGIGAIVSLTERPLEKAFLNEFGFDYLHLPIADFTAPSQEQIFRFLKFLESMQRKETALVVHCAAGLGRTGTMLACALVSRGMTADAAIDQVRMLRPYSIETCEQEECIRNFAEVFASRAETAIMGTEDAGQSGPEQDDPDVSGNAHGEEDDNKPRDSSGGNTTENSSKR